MSTPLEIQPQSDRELVLSRLIDAPVEKVYRAWTDSKQLPHWFAPKPWTVSRADLDVRPGGTTLVVMKGPEGEEFPNQGVYLEVVPNQKLVFTDAFTQAWQPSGRAFMVVTITFENQGGKTKYTARAMHWSKEACEEHAKMGFHQGWGICTDQLEQFVRGL